MSQNGKGDKRRPTSIGCALWQKNWEQIFGKKKKKKKNGKHNN